MSLRDKLKQRPATEEIVEMDGDKYLVRFPGRIAKNKAFAKAQRRDELDGDLLEAQLLAICVMDPETQQPVMPDPTDWDLPSDVSPLVSAVIRVCRLGKDEAKAMGKDSGESDS